MTVTNHLDQASRGSSGAMSRRVYLDHNASTPVHPEVVAEMLPYFGEVFGNPSSVHGFGRAAREAVDLARERVATFLRTRPDDIVFTSGGTESDNFGVKGLAWARGRGHLRQHGRPERQPQAQLRRAP